MCGNILIIRNRYDSIVILFINSASFRVLDAVIVVVAAADVYLFISPIVYTSQIEIQVRSFSSISLPLFPFSLSLEQADINDFKEQ